MNMDTKTEFKSFVEERLSDAASVLFINRALKVIDESPDDKNSLIVAAERVSKMVSLFIDKNLANEISKRLYDMIAQTQKTI